VARGRRARLGVDERPRARRAVPKHRVHHASTRTRTRKAALTRRTHAGAELRTRRALRHEQAAGPRRDRTHGVARWPSSRPRAIGTPGRAQGRAGGARSGRAEVRATPGRRPGLGNRAVRGHAAAATAARHGQAGAEPDGGGAVEGEPRRAGERRAADGGRAGRGSGAARWGRGGRARRVAEVGHAGMGAEAGPCAMAANTEAGKAEPDRARGRGPGPRGWRLGRPRQLGRAPAGLRMGEGEREGGKLGCAKKPAKGERGLFYFPFFL
jgi:hypothetical protein